jgi:hypothetical protein
MTDTICWTAEEWRAAIGSAGLTLRAAEDVSEALRDGLAALRGQLDRNGGIAKRLIKTGGGQLIDHYRRELAGDRRYLVMIGNRSEDEPA